MKNDDFIISGFDSDAGAEPLLAVDFSKAKRLDRGGSTCDAYECVVQRRRVFVKRLKAEYRDNPLHRAAFSKEYDLGVSLSHPSLPHYVGFGGDYIVIDYVEGDTFADLIGRGDPRLGDNRFKRKLLGELVDAVSYLHNRNVVHCDIKADNIIVSPYPDRPVTLIDLDKAYSSWFDSTHGSAAKYGCEDCADGAIDFKGIGLIAAKLGMKRVAMACGKDGVTVDSLRGLLMGRKKYLWGIIAGSVVACVLVAVALWPKDVPEIDDKQRVASDTAIVVDWPRPSGIAPQPAATPRPVRDMAWVATLIAEKSIEIDGYRLKLLAMLDCDSISIGDKRTAIMDYMASAGLVKNEIIFAAVRHYSDFSESDVQKAVRQHPGWMRLEKEEAEMWDRINGWDAKVSRRSSGHPASPPDTILSDDHPAPRH